MANRAKEDEKNERIIRSLQKLPENRRCINCNSLGPQYVCTNFWTFVCTTCGGIHREFSHRVKSISMAKFVSQEVTALQGGGNARAKESLFKELDPQRHSFPDSSNIERLRTFIKHVYVERRYTGEKGIEKPPKVEESYENKKTDLYQTGSRSPPYEDTYEQRRYNDGPSPGGKSDDSNSKYDEGRSPGYRYDRESSVGVVNYWRRDDRFGNAKKTSDGDSKLEDKDMASPSPPIVRPVRDILGDSVLPLRISEPPKSNGNKVATGFANTLRASSSRSMVSTVEKPVEIQKQTFGSLIDFDADPEPPVKPRVQQTHTAQPTAQPTDTSSDTNWASFDLPTDPKVSHLPSNVNNLDSVFSQLSVSGTANADVAPLFTSASFQSSTQQFNSPAVASTTQPWNSPLAPNAMGHSSNRPAQVPGNSSILTQPTHVEPKLSGRTALPEDLFAATYPSVPSWPSGPALGMGYNVHNNSVMPVSSFPQYSKVTNPFDLNEQTQFQAPLYPSMTYFRSMPRPTGSPRSSQTWMPPQSSFYAPTLPPQAPYHASAQPQRGAYMGQQQQIYNNMPPSWHQGGGSFMNSNQHLGGGGGGNPFG